MTRWILLLALGALCSTNTIARGEPNRSEAPVDRAVAKEARVRATHRRRRIIFNDDSEALARKEAATAEGFLSVRLTPMLHTQVDTICFSALAIWGDAPIYDSKVQPLFGRPAHGIDAPGEDLYEHYAANAKTLIEAGDCPLRIVTDFAHEHGMEAFASIRMNDVHDSFVPGIKTLWKRNHPEYLVQVDGKPPFGKVYATSQDYTHQAVRDRKFEVIEEIGKRYDIDGFEFDYFRHPVFFTSSARGGSASVAEIAIMTSFMDRLRRRIDELAAQRKRPILVAARVPDTFDRARRLGLDIEAWLKQDLVDILIIGGGYSPFSLKVNDLVKTAHEHDVLVYPCINTGPLMDFTSVDDFHPAARAATMNWRRSGADGVYLWNLGTPFSHDQGQEYVRKRAHFYACLSDIGDVKTMANGDKLYTIDGPTYVSYVHASTRPQLPVSLLPGKPVRLQLAVGDDLQQATRADRLRQSELRLTLSGPFETDALAVWLNSTKLAEPGFAHIKPRDATSKPQQPASLVTFTLTTPPLKQGVNTLEITFSKNTATSKPITLQRVHLALDYE